MKLDAGTVIRWDKFNAPHLGGEIKARWFIILGDSGPLSNILMFYSLTTTTQKGDFEPGRKREHHCYYVFKKTARCPFDEECILDFDEEPYPIEYSKVIKHQNDIEIKGMLEPNVMQMIWNQLKTRLSNKVLSDIHASYNRVGIYVNFKKAKK